MSNKASIKKALLLGLIITAFGLTAKADQITTKKDTGKAIYKATKIYMVPANNNFADSSSEFSNSRKVESPDIVMYWAKEYGNNPVNNPRPNGFNPTEAIKELERYFVFYRDTLKFVTKGSSVTDAYKMMTFVFYDPKQGTAFGGGIDNKVGALWTPAVRIARPPYGALAHELGHSFQNMVHADGNWGYSSSSPGGKGQPIFEMTSQYMLFQVYPLWMTFENFHLVDFMRKTHLAFLHEENQYNSPYVLEYWSNKHGLDFVGHLWRSAVKGEDPVMTYKRLNSLSQPKFNDEMFDACRRFITWDMPRIEKVAKPYANKHNSTLNSVGDGWYKIAESNCPQNYGYNGIKLKVPAAGTKVTLDFKGIAGTEGYRAINIDKAGWRYGFVAVKEDGSRTYGKVYSKVEGDASIKIPEHTSYLWLVVMGAPTEHWEHLSDRNNVQNDEQWPYQIKLTGTSLDDADIK
jgi:hypothetical protein